MLEIYPDDADPFDLYVVDGEALAPVKALLVLLAVGYCHTKAVGPGDHYDDELIEERWFDQW